MNGDKTIIRVRKQSNFVIVSRFPLEDERMTWEGRGVFAFLMAKPDNWQISVKHLAKSSPAGYDKTKRILNELIKLKYIRKEKRRTKRGRFTYPVYTIYELPYDGYFTGGENPLTVNPVTDTSKAESPVAADPQLIKKQCTKEETTTTNGLSWPSEISELDRQSMLELAKSLEPEVVQILLDEISGKLNSINSPVSYFFTLIKRYREGVFIPANSNPVKVKRDSRLAGEERYRRILQESENRARKLFEEHQREND